MTPSDQTPEQRSAIGKLIRFCLANKLVVFLFTLAILAGGWLVAPFEWEAGGLNRYPIAVDAIPDIGENQQIVFTKWMGRSPQDVEDQISYPLTVSLLGVPGVKTIRSYSMFGFSTIYIIFKDDVEFYWSRTRVLEKLNSLPAGTLPQGVQPSLGPDATALGQIYWYTLEGRDPDGHPIGGWDLAELRTVQDWYVRYALLAADGVAEVASIGGYVQEYQVDVDPNALRAHGVSLEQISHAVKASNIDVGARTLELNNTEYFIRGIGFIERVADIENSVVVVKDDNIPILVKHVASVSLGPETRRGALDKGGSQVAGGVVVARYGDNPLAAINNVKKKIEETRESLPAKAIINYALVTPSQVKDFTKKLGFEAFTGSDLNHEDWLAWLRSVPREEWPAWVTTSKVTVVAFYDRTGLIYETLGTLNEAIGQEILITIIVVLFMVMHLRSSILISALLPLSVLLCFVAMKLFGVQANIVALSGIAIAIGTIVDMGVVICENILRHLKIAKPGESPLETVHRAASEVGGAVLTAVATTVVSFLPVFTMLGAEGKLFKPLAYTKSFALIASILIALTVLPPAAQLLFTGKIRPGRTRSLLNAGLIMVGLIVGVKLAWWAGILLAVLGLYFLFQDKLPRHLGEKTPWMASIIALFTVALLLTKDWEPLGLDRGMLRNFIFVAILIGGLLLFFKIFQHFYGRLLAWCLRHKIIFMVMPMMLVLFGITAWLGFDTYVGSIPKKLDQPLSQEELEELNIKDRFYHNLAMVRNRSWKNDIESEGFGKKVFWTLGKSWNGMGKEFMPPLDEGSYLFMPTTMTHASIGEAIDVLSKQDMAFEAIPEIESAVGKIGRAETPLDPAPISMIETVINYKPEFMTDRKGHRINFRYDRKKGEFERDGFGELIPDASGRPYRQWRAHIRTPDDIWEEIVKAAKIPGSTSAPKLQPIAARIVMLASGMRAPMGVKVKGPDLETIEQVGLQIERFLKEVPSVQPAAVIADRIVGKPYLEIVPDRKALARYGVPIRQFQDVVEVAIGGRITTTTVEGRERYPVRVRYQRELRDSIEAMEKIYVSGSGGAQIPITQLAEIRYVRGPQVIKSEDTFLIGYVVFDKITGKAEVDVVEECQAYLQLKMDSGEFNLPSGVSYTFAGNYENQLRAAHTLALILPIALFVIFMLIYLQFKRVSTTLLIFSGILVAWSGGFVLIWLYGQPWFFDFSVFGVPMRDLFQMHTINMSVAVWVGFLALFGIATDNGVIQSVYLDQVFRDRQPASIEEIRKATLVGAERRVRPCLMTSATTILALIPILTSTGRGSDVMVPMAIPSFGGMLVVLISIFVVPVLYCAVQEAHFRRTKA